MLCHLLSSHSDPQRLAQRIILSALAKTFGEIIKPVWQRLDRSSYRKLPYCA